MERRDTFKTDITISPNCAVLTYYHGQLSKSPHTPSNKYLGDNLIARKFIFRLVFCWKSNTVCPVPGPSCNSAGSYSALPDGMSGRCRCKPGYYGDLCQFSAIISQPGPGQCGDNQFLSREKAVGGCINW